MIVSGSTLTLSSSPSGDLNLLGDLTVSGTLTTNSRTVKFQGGSATQNITTAATFGDVSILKTGGTVKLGGALTVNGALQFDGSGSAVDVLEFNQNTLNLNGTVGGASSSVSNGFKGDATGATLNVGGAGALGTVKFVSGSQSLKSLTVNRSSSGTLTLGTNLTIGNAGVGSLALTNGIVDAGSNTLSLASFPTITRTNGYVIGNLQKTFASTGNFTFTVGTANGYSPVDVNVTAGTGNSLTVKAVQGAHPNIYTGNALQRYWTISNSGSVTINLTFNYLAGDVIGTEANYKIFKDNGSFTQFAPTTLNTTSHFATLNGVSSFSDWTLADPTLTVNTTADTNDGACTALGTGNGCTLREAINTANSSGDPNPINFSLDPSDPGCVSGVCTITLTSALPDLSTDITINGTGANSLIVKRSTAGGTPNFRLFTVNAGKFVTVSGLTIMNGNVTGLFPGGAGGGILNDRGTLTVIGCVIAGNGATGGGGINNGASNGGTLTVLNSTISGNVGGGIYNTIVSGGSNSASLTVVSSTISGNSSTSGLGAGIETSVGSSGTANATIINSTISGNTASGGGSSGGIYAAAIFGGTATLSITNSTITANNGNNSTAAGGIQNALSCSGGGCSSTVLLRNTIVAGNTRSGSANDIGGTVDSSSSFNLIGFGGSGGLTNGVNNNQVGVVSPLLGTLANNGGPTQTHALLPGSPAINAGSNAILPADTFDLDGDSNTAEALPVDQRGAGFSRIVNTTVDIGAFESRGFSISASSGTPQSTLILTSFASPLVATVTSAFGEPVAGGVVTFTAPDPNAGPSATFPGPASTATATINGSGAATSPTLTANTSTGTYNIVASIGSGPPMANFALTNKASTLTQVSSSVNPSLQGQNVTFTAKVSAAGGAPTGTVQFKDGGVNLGSPQTLQPVSFFSQATISTSALTPGTHTITADYSGDSNFNPSSGTLSAGQVVNQPSLSINDVSTSEGDSGTKTLSFTVTLSVPANLTVTANYATADNTAIAPGDYVAQSGMLTFNPGDTTKTIDVTINGDQAFESNETFFVNLSSPTNATISDNQGVGTIVNDDAQGGNISFSQANYAVNENDGSLTLNVNRTGELSGAVTVSYATNDRDASIDCSVVSGLASSRCDFTTALGVLQFNPGETQKSIVVLVTRDSYSEGPESFHVGLNLLTGGAVFGGPATATVTINDSPPPSSNPIDDSSNFVRQHYHDFLNREPDGPGLQFWTNEIESCGANAACREVKRINVSGAFFLSIEFQETGYLVERLYKTAYGDAQGNSTFPSPHTLPVPIVRLNEFLADTQQIGQGVVVGQPGWQEQLENNKVAFIGSFVQRERFTNAFGSMTNAQFVDALNANAGNPLSQSERNQLVADLNNNTKTRAQVLRAIAEHPNLVGGEFNRAFVLMQFFGYLRRNPDDARDTDYTGYDFWLTKLNQFNGNFQNAEMVKAFINSDEYRHRFGP